MRQTKQGTIRAILTELALKGLVKKSAAAQNREGIRLMTIGKGLKVTMNL